MQSFGILPNKTFPPFYVVDSNRSAFEKVALGVFAAVRCVLTGRGSNRISVLLMGRKGLGKSSLLESVIWTLQHTLQVHVVALFVNAPDTVDLQNGSYCKLPSVLLLEQAHRQGHKLPKDIDSSNIDDVLTAFFTSKLCPIFALDGADAVFPKKDGSDCAKVSHYEHYNRQLNNIGNKCGCLGIITGSAKRLRSLAYAVTEDHTISEYHTFRSLNGTKYQEVAIRPMQPSEIPSFVKRLEPTLQIDDDDEKALEIFAHTGGIQGFVDQWVFQRKFPVPEVLPNPLKAKSRNCWHVLAHIANLNIELISSEAIEGPSFAWVTKITGITEKGLKQLLSSLGSDLPADDDTR